MKRLKVLFLSALALGVGGFALAEEDQVEEYRVGDLKLVVNESALARWLDDTFRVDSVLRIAYERADITIEHANPIVSYVFRVVFMFNGKQYGVSGCSINGRYYPSIPSHDRLIGDVLGFSGCRNGDLIVLRSRELENEGIITVERNEPIIVPFR